MSKRRARWAATISVCLALCSVLLFGLLGLDRADKLAGVLSFYVAAGSLAIAVGATILTRRFASVARSRSAFIETGDALVHTIDSKVAKAQRDWVETRGVLNGNRAYLAHVAAEMYGPDMELADTGLITRPGWLPARPVDLSAVRISRSKRPGRALLSGSEPETLHVRPPLSPSRWYPTYTEAMLQLDRPKHFQSRLSWRLLDVAPGSTALTFGETTYFEALDVCEAVAHETSLAYFDASGKPRSTRSRMVDLPFRHRIGDPLDLSRRPVLPAISTLLIRNSADGPEFILHRRDPRKVAIAGNMLQVIPSGAFQPSSPYRHSEKADFDLWRNIMREFSEELLGNPEHGGYERAVDYGTDPFLTLDEARDNGHLAVSLLGVGLDALTLWGEILTVAVFEATLFDRLRTSFVHVNDEGTIPVQVTKTEKVIETRPFTWAHIRDLIDQRRIAPAGAGCLHLAWQHRDALLAG